MTLADVHRWLAWFLVLSNAAVGAWALVAQQYESWRRRELWWATTIAHLSTFAVAISGVVWMQADDLELEQFHALYGFSTIVAVAILYSYRSSPFVKDRVHLLYGFGSLFIMGLGIRAMFL